MAREAPHLLRPDHVAALQSSAGNRTVQGLFGFGKKKKPVASPLTWQNTQWADTRFLSASSEGSNGVLFAGARGKEVVVKPGEAMDVEGGVASYLVSQAMTAGRTGVALAPGYRVASTAETRQMEQAFKGLVSAAGKEKRVSTLIGKLPAGNVVVQDMAQGKPLNKALDDMPKHTKQRRFGGGRKLRANSPMRIFTDARKIHAMGSAHASDMFMGNDDRLAGFNLENIMVSKSRLEMIDNVMDVNRSHLRSFVVGKGKLATKHSADSAFEDWKKHGRTQQLAAGKFDEIAAEIFQTLLKEAPKALHPYILDSGGERHHGRDVDADAIQQILLGFQDQFETAFAAGLQVGRGQVIRSLNRMLQIEGNLEAIAGRGDVTEVRRSLTMRRDFLVNGS